jgi:hypothetical protein
MTKTFTALMKQPYWVIALILGVLLVAGPSLTIDKSYLWYTHPPTTYVPVVIGICLLILSAAAFGYSTFSKPIVDIGSGVDLARVKEAKGAFWTKVSGCEIRITNGRIEDYAGTAGIAVVLPCNEYFDDRCVDDTRSALGSYVNRAFDGQTAEFVSLMKNECRNRFGPGTEQQKTESERAESFGTGRCLLLIKPLKRTVTVALVSTTTQRAGQGLSSRISYLFDGMSDLVANLANERINEIVMPILGSGHGGLDPPLALFGLLGALAEAARYGQGSQRLKKVTIVLFKRDTKSSPQVDPVVVRRALAIVGSRE